MRRSSVGGGLPVRQIIPEQGEGKDAPLEHLLELQAVDPLRKSFTCGRQIRRTAVKDDQSLLWLFRTDVIKS